MDHGKIVVIPLRHVRTQYQTIVLRDRSQRLTYGYIIALFHLDVLQVTVQGRDYRHAFRRLFSRYRLISDLGVLVIQAGLLEILGGYDLIAYQGLHTLVFLFRRLISEFSLCRHVSIREGVGSDTQHGLSLAYRRTIHEWQATKRDHAGDGSDDHGLLPLRRHYSSARLNHIRERSGINRYGLQTNGLG